MADQREPRLSHRERVVIAIGLVVLAFNLRPAAVSVGPVLDDIRKSLSIGPAVAGVVTTLPVLCFAAFGALAPWCARRFGAHRVMLASLALLAAGIAVRADAGDAAVFILATIPALAGMATANVLLPSLVKQHFPHRVGTMTGVYTTSLAIGLTAASTATVPIAGLTGSWRGGLLAWAFTAAIAAVPWFGLLRHDVHPDLGPQRSIPGRALARSSLAWSMAVFFGMQSLQAYAVFGWLPQVYRDAGFSAETAGLLLGVTTATTIPLSFLLPSLAARVRSQAPMILALCSSYVLGYLGLLLSPTTLPWLWALLIGVGSGIFPLVLGIISLRARTSDGTAALSGFTQSIGYLIAAGGPFMIGAVYGATGGWTVPLLVLIALLLPQAVAGVLVSRERYVEDELAR